MRAAPGVDDDSEDENDDDDDDEAEEDERQPECCRWPRDLAAPMGFLPPMLEVDQKRGGTRHLVGIPIPNDAIPNDASYAS